MSQNGDPIKIGMRNAMSDLFFGIEKKIWWMASMIFNLKFGGKGRTLGVLDILTIFSPNFSKDRSFLKSLMG